MSFTIHLACPEFVLLNEIEQGVSQKELAQTYAMAIHATRIGGEVVDWKRVHAAMAARWKPSSIERVKRMAWRIIEQAVKANVQRN